MSVTRLRTSSLVLPAAFIMATAAACGGRDGSPPAKAAPAVEVRVAKVAVQRLAQTFEAGGVIKARATAQISPRIAAELREVKVQPGDRVRRGQIVAVLDDRDLAATRAQAQASVLAAQSGTASAEAERESASARLLLARASHRRIEQLRERNSATPQELDRATAELQMAEAAVRAATARAAEASALVTSAEAAGRAAQVTASFATVVAPFDGLVTNRLLEPGNMASPGVPLLTIETTDGFRLEVQIDEARARLLALGDAAAVAFDGKGEGDTVAGRVVEIARAVDPGAHAFVVKVQLPSGIAVRSGMFARARFESDKRDALAVPSSAIVRRGQLSLVFVVDSSRRARMRAITTGARSRDAAEVLAGIQPGETVVTSPPASLIDGAEVRATGGRP